MADNRDNRDNRGSPDRKRINVNQPHEVQYWTKKFQVSPEKLKRAVKMAGTSAAAVKKWLDKH